MDQIQEYLDPLKQFSKDSIRLIKRCLGGQGIMLHCGEFLASLDAVMIMRRVVVIRVK